MALFQSYDKIMKWCNKKTVKRRKAVEMKLRSGKKLLNDNMAIHKSPNKHLKENKNCSESVVKKQKKNYTIKKLCPFKKQSKSSTTNHKIFGPINLTPDQTVCQVINESSTSLAFPATSPIMSGSSKIKNQIPTSSYLSMISSSSYELKDQPYKSLNLPSTSTSFQIRNQLSETFQRISTNNDLNNLCAVKSTNSKCSSKNTSLSPDSIISKINSVENPTPLFVDATNISKQRSQTKTVSILERIVNEDSKNNKQDELRKNQSQKRKRSISIEKTVSSMRMLNIEQLEKDDDEHSIISIPSDDDSVIIEDEAEPKSEIKKKNTNSHTQPFKRRRISSEVTIIDLCTPEHSSDQRKIKSKDKNNHSFCKVPRTSKKKTKFSGLQSSLMKSSMGILQPYNSVVQNKLSSTSGKKCHAQNKTLKNYKSILGNKGQRGPFPCNSSTVTSSDNTASEMILSNVPSSIALGNNAYNPNPVEQTGLRPIAIDGSNVAYGHANGAYFSSKGLKICIDFFLNRGHKVTAFVPKFRKFDHDTKDPEILDDLERRGLVTFTPSRRIRGKLVVSYDDRYVVQYAAACGGVIVSTDNYKDLFHENRAWRDAIERRLLMFSWVEDYIFFPQDPLGRNGPNLAQFLSFPR